MKILLGTKPPSDSWVSTELPKDVLKALLDSLLSSSVLVEDDNFIATMREISERHRNSLTLVLESISRIPRVEKVRESDIDFIFSTPENITSFPSNPAYLSARDRHTSIASPGESRDAFYERTFGHLLRNSKKFVVYDPYGLENLVKPYSGISWLVRERLSRLPIQLELHALTSVYDAATLEEESVNQVASMLRGAKNVHSDFSVSLILYDKTRKGNHDRFARIVFDRNSVSCELSKGAEIFREAALSEAYKIHTLTLSEFEAKANSWPSKGIVFKKVLAP